MLGTQDGQSSLRKHMRVALIVERERELQRLVIRGRSEVQIAERNVVTFRTFCCKHHEATDTHVGEDALAILGLLVRSYWLGFDEEHRVVASSRVCRGRNNGLHLL